LRLDLLRRQARAQPPNLAAMIDFVFRDVEPRPVCVDPWRRLHRAGQPSVVASSERFQRDSPDSR
jgi:hypothetical protein